MTQTQALNLTVDGELVTVVAGGERSLLEVLREDVGRTSVKEGCDDGECGACTVLLGRRAVTACLVLAQRAAGDTVQTAEGVASTDGSMHPLQTSLLAHGAVQCGYCTPGIVMAVLGAAAAGEPLDEAGCRRAVSGNLCRCTGYLKIVDAVVAWAAAAPEVNSAHTDWSTDGPAT